MSMGLNYHLKFYNKKIVSTKEISRKGQPQYLRLSIEFNKFNLIIEDDFVERGS